MEASTESGSGTVSFVEGQWYAPASSEFKELLDLFTNRPHRGWYHGADDSVVYEIMGVRSCLPKIARWDDFIKRIDITKPLTKEDLDAEEVRAREFYAGLKKEYRESQSDHSPTLDTKGNGVTDPAN